MFQDDQFRNKWKTYVFGAPLILVIAGAIIISLALLIIPNFGSIGTDGSLYTLLGKNLAEGRGFTTYGESHTIFSPLLPILISITFFFTDSLDVAAHAPIVLLLVGMMPLVYLLGSAFANRSIGLFAAIYTTLSGYLLWTSFVSVNAQTIAGFFTLLFLLFAYQEIGASTPEKRRPYTLFFSGIALALAYLARPEYIMLFPVVVVVIWMTMRRYVSQKELWMKAGAFTAGFFLLAAPYIAYLSVVQGSISLTGRTNEAVLIVTSGGTEGYEAIARPDGIPTIVTPPELQGGVLGVVKKNLFPLIKRILEGILQTERSIMNTYGIFGILLLAFGLRAMVFEKKWRELSLLLVGLIPMSAIAVFQGGSGNYLIQFFPIFNIIIAWGTVVITREAGGILSFSELRTRTMNGVLVVIMALYLFFPVLQLYIFLPPDYQDREYTKLGTWMSENIPNINNVKVASRKPEPVVRAGAIWTMLPDATSTDALVQFMKRTNTEYLVADSRTWVTLRPKLMDLIEKTDVPPELVLVQQTEHVGQRALLWRLLPSDGSK